MKFEGNSETDVVTFRGFHSPQSVARNYPNNTRGSSANRISLAESACRFPSQKEINQRVLGSGGQERDLRMSFAAWKGHLSEPNLKSNEIRSRLRCICGINLSRRILVSLLMKTFYAIHGQNHRYVFPIAQKHQLSMSECDIMTRMRVFYSYD